MAAPTKGSKLEKIHEGLCKVMIDALEGEYAMDREGNLVLVDEKPLKLQPKAGVMKEIREFLKDNGIDSEVSDGSALSDLTKKVRSYTDEPLFIPERDNPTNISGVA